ncbi:MAG: glycosyltransferase family 4 protein [bacterium]
MIKNILHLRSSNGIFGAENVILNLLTYKKNDEFQHHLGVLENRNNTHNYLIDKAQNKKIIVVQIDCKGRLDIKTISILRDYITRNNIQLIHCHDYKSNFYGLITARLKRIKIITTCHNWASNTKRMKIYKAIDKFLLRYFNEVIAVSDSVADELQRGGILKEKITTIYNGVNIERFSDNGFQKFYTSRLKRELNIGPDNKIIGTVGRLTSEKGHAYLIKAAKEVIQTDPNVRFLIVGDGPLMNSLRVIASYLEIDKSIIFPGAREDIVELLNLMDIFVLPSLTEGMPLALLEAMAAQRPVIATEVGGVPRVVTNNQTGLLIKPANVSAIVEGIRLLLADIEKAGLLAKSAFECVGRRFSLDEMARGYASVYQRWLPTP